MKRIILTQGKEALVDDCDYDFLSQWDWHVYINGGGNKLYARTWKDSKNTDMHRLLAIRYGFPTELSVDHINGDSLDNQRSNLRPATLTENLLNRGPTCKNISGFKGVSPTRNKWRATINVDKKQIFLGSFDTPLKAAKAYNKAAEEHFGEFAWLNPIDGSQ